MKLCLLCELLLAAYSLSASDCSFRVFIWHGYQFSIARNVVGYNTSSENCNWFITSPPATRMDLKCSILDIPQSWKCSSHYLSVSTTGTLDKGLRYCGRGMLEKTSNANKLSIQYFSTYRSIIKGRILCSISIEDAAAKYMKLIGRDRPKECRCGFENPHMRLVGGNDTLPNEFPSMAALVHLSHREINCGATIITERYAITAAHCLDKRYFPIGTYALLVGDHNVSSSIDTANAALYEISEHIVHENYNHKTILNDIGLVKTKRPMLFNADVGPVCLPYKYKYYDFADEMLTALGWGSLSYTGRTSDTLQEVELKVVNQKECQEKNSDHNITHTQICTYERGKDSCQYDSGGPLLWSDRGKLIAYLVGLVSFGRGCAGDSPSVNTRITPYLKWIQEKTGIKYCTM